MGNKIAGGLGCQADLSMELEQQPADNVIRLEERFYGLTLSDLRRLAFQIVEAINVKTRFNLNTKLAAKQWLRDFLERHPQLSLYEDQKLHLWHGHQGLTQLKSKKFLIYCLILCRKITLLVSLYILCG